MVLVGSSEAFTGVAFSEQTAWATANDTDADFVRVLITGETMTRSVDAIERNPEFGDAGALQEVEFGRGLTSGDISFRPRYDSPATHILFGHFFGDEQIVVDKRTNGVAAAGTNGNTHFFGPTATIPKGLTFRVFKSGPSDAGYIHRHVGVIPVRLTLDQAENRPLVCTMGMIGKSPTLVAATGKTLPAIIGSNLVKFADLSRGAPATESRFRLGLSGTWATSLDVKVRRFRVTLSRNVEFAGPFLGQLDPIDAPLKIDTNDMQVEMEFALEQADMAALVTHPINQHRNRTAGQLDIRWSSASLTTDLDEREMRLHMPKIEWTRVDDSMQGPGLVVVRATGTAVKGTVITEATTDLAASPIASKGNPSDVRCFIFCDDADELAHRGAVDKTFSKELPSSTA